jgi:RNA polymerase sigma-70 factor, ECF subfamily
VYWWQDKSGEEHVNLQGENTIPANQLMVRIARGERSALESLFRSEAGRLIAVARRIVRRTDLAEEVVQDSFVAIWERAAQFDPGRGDARGWITRIVRNRALNLPTRWR